MKIMKRLLAGLVCALMLNGLMWAASADGPYEYSMKSSYEDGDCFRITIDGLEIRYLEYEPPDDDVENGAAWTSTTLAHGRGFCVRVDWTTKNAIRGVDISYCTSPYVNSTDTLKKYQDAYSRGDASVTNPEDDSYKNHFYDDFTTPWTQLISGSDDTVEFYITAPDDPEISEIDVYVSCREDQFALTVYLSNAEVLPVESQTVTETGGLVVESTSHNAEASPGEDGGTSLWDQIVEGWDGSHTAAKVAVSVGGALAAAGAAAAISGGTDGGSRDGEGEEKKKRYKMKVYKNFGDAIRRGAEAVQVWARIVEVVEGEEINRTDLSARITVTGTGMDVRPIGMRNTYMGAEVIIPADSQAQSATLTFTYRGVGGVFHNSVVFRVLGDPEIVFPELTEDGSEWDLTASHSELNMIAGEGGQDTLRFVIVDADQEPKDIRFSDCDGFVITRENDPRLPFAYFARVENRTAPIEKKNGVFAKVQHVDVTVEAEFPDGIVIRNRFCVNLFPEGVAVDTYDQFIRDDRLLVDTLPKDKKTLQPGESSFKRAPFFVSLAYLGNDGKVVVTDKPLFYNGELVDDGKYGLMFTYFFMYHVSDTSDLGGIDFWPEETVPMLGDGYDVRLLFEVEEQGRRFSAELPLLITGKGPERVYGDEARQKSIELLRKDIKYFGLSGDPATMAMLRKAVRGECSLAEINNVRYRLLEATVRFYYEVAGAEKQMSELFSRYIVVAGSLVKAMDYALEFVMDKQWPGYGRIAAKFINPLKNLLGTYLGELIANGDTDNAPDFIEVALKSCEEALSEAITGLLIGKKEFSQTAVIFGKETKAADEIKNMIGYIIAVYLLTCFVQHYYGYKENKGQKGDVFRSVIAALADLGYESLKAWFLDFIVKNCASLFDKIGTWCADKFKALLQGRINAAALQAGQKVYGEMIKGKFRETGINSSELSQAVYTSAKDAKELAKRTFIDNENAKIEAAFKTVSNWLSDKAEVNLESPIVGQALNYFFGGDGDDGETALGWDAKEVLYAALTKWLGVKLGNVYEIGSVLNPFAVTYRVENGKIYLGLFGYCAEISILENIIGLCELLYEGLFSWLEARWEASKTALDPNAAPDPRERIEQSVRVIGEEMDRQKQKIESFEWEYTKYKKKTESGWETVL